VEDEGGSAGPPLDTIPRGTSPLRIAEQLWNHGPAMISAIEDAGLEVPKFEGNEIIDLFAYVRSHGERYGALRFQSPGDPEAGREVFEDKGCSACHPVFGDEPGVGPDLGRAELRGSVTQIAGRMWNHWPNMARTMEQAGMSVPEFAEGELLDLFAYLFIARYEDEPGDPEGGRNVYDDKGCAVCHGADGSGTGGDGTGGTSLREALVGESKESIMQAMWNHAPQMGALMRDQDLSWVRLSAADLADLLAFLAAGWPQGPEQPNK
jgi:mono/diheme cytochrome c family protein